MALNDANRTGNYSVLRDLAGPRFQSLNSAARLADTFRGFREANLDLSRAALASSDLATTGVRERDGILVLAGRLPLQAAGGEAEHQSSSKAVPSLRFDLVFEPVAGHWRLLTLSVAVGDR